MEERDGVGGAEVEDAFDGILDRVDRRDRRFRVDPVEAMSLSGAVCGVLALLSGAMDLERVG